jgi:coenzyme PQQ precursor peptide PqqA
VANNSPVCCEASPSPTPFELEVSEMAWETPTFVEVKMDAEINSYQEDFDDRF